MLRGNALAKVDGKGRLKLPAVFRTHVEASFGTDFFITSIRGQSARIYPMQVYTELEERLLAAPTLSPKLNKLKTALNYYGQRAAMDAQGRLLVHPLLRSAADITGEVTVLGMQNFLEVWNHDQFQKSFLDDPLTDDDLQEISEFGF